MAVFLRLAIYTSSRMDLLESVPPTRLEQRWWEDLGFSEGSVQTEDPVFGGSV